MCGRFDVDIEKNKELKKILHTLDRKYPGNRVKQGEVFPTDQAAILIEDPKTHEIVPELSKWGFPGFQGKGMIINARSETAMEKATFKESLVLRRCLVPTSGFYEWDEAKNKYLFQDSSEITYLAGMYNMYKGLNHFVILTTNANPSMEDVHSRMPIVISDGDKEGWIKEREKTTAFLEKVPEALKKTRIR